jgi:hypothetical protein
MRFSSILALQVACEMETIADREMGNKFHLRDPSTSAIYLIFISRVYNPNYLITSYLPSSIFNTPSG